MQSNQDEIIAHYDLPGWMRQAQRGIDWGALLIIGFALLIAWPFISGVRFPQGMYTQHDVFRAADYAALMAEGQVFPRWSPHTFNGYGAPIAHFYPPGAPYLAALIDVFFTNDTLLSVRLVYTAAILLGSSTLYAFVSHRLDGTAGLLAGLVYLVQPYLSLTVPHITGELSQVLGIALLPTLLWVFNRLLRRQLAPDIALAAIVTAALIMTAPNLLPSAAILIGLLVGHHTLQMRSLADVVWVLLAILIGSGLSSFYWVPAYFELDLVRWQAAVIAAPSYIVGLSDLIQLPDFLSSQFSWQLPRFSLGSGLFMLGFCGTIAALIAPRRSHFSLTFLVAGALLLVSVLFVAPASNQWLPVVILCFIIGGAGIGCWLLPARWWTWIVLLVIVAAIGFDATRIIFLPDDTVFTLGETAAEQRAFERNGNGVSVLAPGLPIPSQMPTRLLTEIPPLEIAEDRTTERFDIVSGEEISLSLLDESLLGGRYQMRVENPVTLTYARAFFAGWHAILADKNIPISLNASGIITFSLPEAEGTFVIQYGSTWLRIIGWLIAGIALILMVGGWLFRWRILTPDYDESTLIPRDQVRLLTLIFMMVIIVRFTPIYNIIEGEVRPNQPTVLANLQSLPSTDNETTLQLFGLASLERIDSRYLEGILFWQIPHSIDDTYLVELHLVSDDQQTSISQTIPVHAGYWPSDNWMPNQIVPHPFIMSLPATIPNETLQLQAHLYLCRTFCSSGSRNDINLVAILPMTDIRLSD